MKHIAYLFLLALSCTDNQKPSDIKSCPTIAVRFSPNGGAENSIIQAIERAKKTVYVQSFSFTSHNIAEALVHAQERGCAVSLIADKEITGNPHSVLKYLKEHQVAVYIDGKHAIAHNKIIIIDGDTVITGSYNFSKGADTKNAENSLIIGDINLAGIYYRNWNEHLEHSGVYED